MDGLDAACVGAVGAEAPGGGAALDREVMKPGVGEAGGDVGEAVFEGEGNGAVGRGHARDDGVAEDAVAGGVAVGVKGDVVSRRGRLGGELVVVADHAALDD